MGLSPRCTLVTCPLMYPILTSYPELSHFPTLQPMLLRTAFQIKSYSGTLVSESLSGGNQNLQYSTENDHFSLHPLAPSWYRGPRYHHLLPGLLEQLPN